MHRRSPNWGRALFLSLWTVGLGALGAMAPGLLPAPGWAVAGVILALALSIAVGVLSQRCGFYARPLTHIPGAGNRLALTFDDGPDEEFTPRVLELLRAAGQRATFFVIADRVARHPELTRRIVAEGHELGNHSTRHPWHLALWTAAGVCREVRAAQAVIERVAGVSPRLFRPPAAVLSPQVERGTRLAGLELVGYSVRSGDGSPLVPAALALIVLRWGLRPGSILLLHDANGGGRAPAALELLPRLFDEMRRRGLTSVPISELVRPADE